MQKKFRSARRKATPDASPDTAADRSPDSALLRLLTESAAQPKDRKRIRPDEKLPLELNEPERDLILNHSFAEQELTDRLRVVPAPIYRFTLGELDELAGYIAAEANHTHNKQQRKEWDRLFHRISATLDSYTDGDN